MMLQILVFKKYHKKQMCIYVKKHAVFFEDCMLKFI